MTKKEEDLFQNAINYVIAKSVTEKKMEEDDLFWYEFIKEQERLQKEEEIMKRLEEE